MNESYPMRPSDPFAGSKDSALHGAQIGYYHLAKAVERRSKEHDQMPGDKPM